MIRLVPFTADDVVREIDPWFFPLPDSDDWWFRINRGADQRAGWVRSTGEKPAPSPAQVADQPNRLLPRFGAALHGRMCGGRGMQLPD
jgi:hypothetical protein